MWKVANDIIKFQGVDLTLEVDAYGNDAWLTITKEGKVLKKINFFGNDYGQLCTIDETPESDFLKTLKEDLPQIRAEEDRREAVAYTEIDYEDDGQPSDLTEFQDLEGEDLPAEE